MLDHRKHQAWKDFRAWLLWREDQDRKAQGLPPLEVEIAEQNNRQGELTPVYRRL